MTRTDRMGLLRTLEAHRGSRVVCYVTSDRQGAPGKIASDAIPWLYSHLRDFGQVDNLDLLLYSAGGITMAGYRIAMLLSQWCSERLAVLVPYKAHSAATLICLAANEIVMSAAGELSPIDPSTQSPFNPAPQPGGGPTSVQVEDVASYFDLARQQASPSEMWGQEEGPIDQDLRRAMVEKAFEGLVANVHPLALGSVNRARRQIRMLARKLLGRTLGDGPNVDRIVDQVTKELYSHDYPITRPEAVDMGLPVVKDDTTEDLVWALYRSFADELDLLKPYSPEEELGSGDQAVVETELAVVESTEAVDAFRTVKRVARTSVLGPGGEQLSAYQEQVISQGWSRKE